MEKYKRRFVEDDVLARDSLKKSKRKMVKVSAIVSHHCINGITLRLSGLKTAGINYKKLPQYCTLEIDLNSIKQREKGEKLQ